MVVENVSPLVVHLVDVGSVCTATEANVKFNFDEKTQPISNAAHGLPTSTFEKTVQTSIESLPRPNKFAEIEEPKSKKRKYLHQNVSLKLLQLILQNINPCQELLF